MVIIKAAVCPLTGAPTAEMDALRVAGVGLVAIEMGPGGIRIAKGREPARP